MGLSNKREEMLKEMPSIRTKIVRSKDGKYLIHRTEFTFIRPINYYKAIVDNTVQVTEEQIDDDLAALDDVA